MVSSIGQAFPYDIVSSQELKGKSISDLRAAIKEIANSQDQSWSRTYHTLFRLEAKTQRTYFLISKDTQKIKGFVTVQKVYNSHFINLIVVHKDAAKEKGGTALIHRVFQDAIAKDCTVALRYDLHDPFLTKFYDRFNPSKISKFNPDLNSVKYNVPSMKKTLGILPAKL